MARPGGAKDKGFFDREMAESYDRRNAALAPISDGLHHLSRMVLAELSPRARILCVGVGTGADILGLAAARPDWSFVGVDPSEAMLGVARRRLGEAGILDRCRLVPGYVEDVPDEGFDAVAALFVAHFVRREARPAFYRGIRDRLRPGGIFVSAEISARLDGPAFPAMLEDWKRVQAMMGASNEALASLDNTLRTTLAVLSPEETEALWRDAGFPLPVRFFQAFMIQGWHARRAG